MKPNFSFAGYVLIVSPPEKDTMKGWKFTAVPFLYPSEAASPVFWTCFSHVLVFPLLEHPPSPAV